MFDPKITTASLELTNNCNLRCKMCNWQTRRKNGYISRQLFENCVDQLSEIQIDTLVLNGGGESLLHPNFPDFLKYAIDKRDLGKIGNVGWTTNGMLFDQRIADLAISLNVDWINFSLDGVGEVNDNIRIGSKYSIIEKNIKYLLKKRPCSNSPKVLLNTVDYGKTEKQKLDLYNSWIDFVDEIELIPSILPDNTCENKDFLSKQPGLVPPPSFCSFSLTTLTILWNGVVTGCCFDTDSKIVLGDVTKQSVKDIWKGSRYQQFRKNLLKNSFSPESPCWKCEFWKLNFEPKTETILNGKGRIEYGYIYRRIRKC
jgi:radical SAM protein with 4Fe4S-binding SPASM domain